MIYLDNAATTKVSPAVADKMNKFFCENYANPSGLYEAAAINNIVMDEGRKELAKALNCHMNEIFYTSGGTESDNWALKGIAYALKDKGNHIITTKIEHHAILNTCEFLEKQGFEVTYLNVDNTGMVRLDELIKSIRRDTILISIMTANNEIGTIQPIEKIGQIARTKRIYFHTDAVQAFGHIPIDVNKCNIDLLSASSHKFNGPKGCGFMYIREGVNIFPFMHGGGQERKKRAGTGNVPGVVGMTEAIKEAMSNMQNRMAYEIRLRDYMINRVLREIPFSMLNGDRYKRLPNNLNISFKNVESENIIALLSDDGICASSGSACSVGDKEISHVLKAIRINKDYARGTIRFTLSHENTIQEIDFTVNRLKEIVYKLRQM